MRGLRAIFHVAMTLAPAMASAQDVWSRADSATVRLAPSAFPKISDSVRVDLTHRGCSVPQVFADTTPHNVISGAFSGPGRRDVAALCSIAGTSRILVYRDGSIANVDSLAAESDRTYLQTIGSGRIGYSRRITVVSPRYMREHAATDNGPQLPPLDHDGINNAFVEKGSSVFYYYGGRWLALPGAD